MTLTLDAPATDATRLRRRGLRVTGPRLAILALLEEIGGHRSADELVLALRRAGYQHARTTVYNALDDLARAGLLRAAPVDAGALRYEPAGPSHHHFVCRRCGLIRDVAVADDLASRPLPTIAAAHVDELDVVYRGLCARCAEQAGSGRSPEPGEHGAGTGGADAPGRRSRPVRSRASVSAGRATATVVDLRDA